MAYRSPGIESLLLALEAILMQVGAFRWLPTLKRHYSSGKMPMWDCLHPGRVWAERLQSCAFTRAKSRRRFALQRGYLCALIAAKPHFKRFSGIKKVHRNSIKITVDLWQRVKDSNPHIQSQSLLCYLYTNPLYLLVRVARTGIIIPENQNLSSGFLKKHYFQRPDKKRLENPPTFDRFTHGAADPTVKIPSRRACRQKNHAPYPWIRGVARDR